MRFSLDHAPRIGANETPGWLIHESIERIKNMLANG
jgi:hypothetical protein